MTAADFTKYKDNGNLGIAMSLQIQTAETLGFSSGFFIIRVIFYNKKSPSNSRLLGVNQSCTFFGKGCMK